MRMTKESMVLLFLFLVAHLETLHSSLLASAFSLGPPTSSFDGTSAWRATRTTRGHATTCTSRHASTTDTDTKEKEDEQQIPFLDLPSSLEKPLESLKMIEFQKIFNDSSAKRRKYSKFDQEGKNLPQERDTSGFDFPGFANNFLKLFQSSDAEKEAAISDIVSKARDSLSTSSDVSDKRTFTELISTFDTYASLLAKVNDRYLSSIDWSTADPTSLFYYLEYEDERKNPSWKRRQHRFFDGIDIGDVAELNEYCDLAHISYADSMEELQQKLLNHATPCELVAADITSEPSKPANYVAIPRDQPSNSDSLEIIMGVRGTKTFADAITDLVCTDEDYRGGKAHAYMLKGGKFLVEQYTPLLERLLELSGKQSIELKLVGHSMGAGAASIAGIEFNDNPKIDAQVIGFGSPALLSEDLAVASTFITTVVNDQDVVPRLSGVTVATLMRDILEFDWFPYAERDAHESIETLHARQPNLLGKELLLQVKEVITPIMKDYAERHISTKTPHRREPVLFPPGKCIHFFRDGVGFSATRVPNTFFSEIDVTRRMLDDHIFHSGYEQTFLAVMREHRNDPHFRFEEATAEREGGLPL